MRVRASTGSCIGPSIPAQRHLFTCQAGEPHVHELNYSNYRNLPARWDVVSIGRHDSLLSALCTP